MHASWKSYHHWISETKISLVDWTFFHYNFVKESDGEGATEQLTAVVHVPFMPTIIRKYLNSLDSHKIH